MIEQLQKDEKLSANKAAMEGLSEMATLLQYCELYGIKDKVSNAREPGREHLQQNHDKIQNVHTGFPQKKSGK